VTAATLRSAHGRARCGYCDVEFDLFDRLSDEPPDAATATAPTDPGGPDVDPPILVDEEQRGGEPASATDPGREVELGSYHFSAEDIEKVFIDARDWQKQYGGGNVAPTPADPEPVTGVSSGAPSGVLAGPPVAEEPVAVEDITLEGLKVEIASITGESLDFVVEFEGAEDEIDAAGDIGGLHMTSRLPTQQHVPDSSPDDEAGYAAKQDETAVYRALLEGRELPAAGPDEPAAPRASAGSSAATPAVTARPASSSIRPDAPSAAAGASAVAAAASAAASQSAIHADVRPTPAERWSAARRARAADEGLPDLDLPRSTLSFQQQHRWLALGSLLLTLVLAVQVIHYYRQSIARHSGVGEVLRRVYALIGQPLSPNWDLDAFEVHQWGSAADIAPGKALTVRARLTNRADHEQPYPLLRLEFEDRFGGAVAQRDFTPAEYLKTAPRAARQLAPGETTDAELSVIAPGGDAVGYTLDICLRESAALIRCAHGGR
jgi:hypothetical protein